MGRGLTTTMLWNEVSAINTIADLHYNENGGYPVFYNLLSVLLFIVLIIAMCIQDKAGRIVVCILMMLFLIANILIARKLKPIERAIRSSLDAVSEYVEVSLNSRYRPRNVHWGISGKIKPRTCGQCAVGMEEYRHITISCADNVILMDEEISPSLGDVSSRA